MYLLSQYGNCIGIDRLQQSFPTLTDISIENIVINCTMIQYCNHRHSRSTVFYLKAQSSKNKDFNCLSGFSQFKVTKRQIMVPTNNLIWPLIYLLFFLHICYSQKYVYCVLGYSGSNIYLKGKNTFYQGWDNLLNPGPLYYQSEPVPFFADRNVFIWKNTTDDCFVFLTLSTPGDRGDTPWPIPG